MMRELGIVDGAARIVNLHPIDLLVRVDPLHILVQLEYFLVAESRKNGSLGKSPNGRNNSSNYMYAGNRALMSRQQSGNWKESPGARVGPAVLFNWVLGIRAGGGGEKRAHTAFSLSTTKMASSQSSHVRRPRPFEIPMTSSDELDVPAD